MTGAFPLPFAPPATESFVSMPRREGALVRDTDGEPRVDGAASLESGATGHDRRETAGAVAARITTTEACSCSDPFTSPAADEPAAKLVSPAPIPGARTFRCESGSESTDTALARVAHPRAGEPRRELIVSRHRSHHGRCAERPRRRRDRERHRRPFADDVPAPLRRPRPHRHEGRRHRRRHGTTDPPSRRNPWDASTNSI